jgi:hypothetical protein
VRRTGSPRVPCVRRRCSDAASEARQRPVSGGCALQPRARSLRASRGPSRTASARKAETDCLADEPARARRRERDTVRRANVDLKLQQEMAAAISSLYPGCPIGRASEIAQHAATRGSGRVGRSADGHALEHAALQLAVIASIRPTSASGPRRTRPARVLGIDQSTTLEQRDQAAGFLPSLWLDPTRPPVSTGAWLLLAAGGML